MITIILILIITLIVEFRYSPRLDLVKNYLGESKLLLYYNSNKKGYITREYIEIVNFNLMKTIKIE